MALFFVFAFPESGSWFWLAPRVFSQNTMYIAAIIRILMYIISFKDFNNPMK